MADYDAYPAVLDDEEEARKQPYPPVRPVAPVNTAVPATPPNLDSSTASIPAVVHSEPTMSGAAVAPRPDWRDYEPAARHGWGKLGEIAASFNPVTNEVFNKRPQARAQQEYEAATKDYDANFSNQMKIAEEQRLGNKEKSEATYKEAQAKALQPTVMIQTPFQDEPIAMTQKGADEYRKTQQQGKTTENVQDKKGVTAANALQEKMNEFRSTDEYRRWKERLDADTKLRVAQLHTQATQNKAPAAIMATAIFAKGGLDRLSDAESAMKELESSGAMGKSLATNKIEDYIFGKGLVDPSLDPKTRQTIGKLRAALGYTSSAAMRAHTGRTSQEIYEDFKNRLGPGQDWNALRGAIEETHGMLYEYATSASDASIAAIRGGTNVTPPAENTGSKQAPKVGDIIKGHKFKGGDPSKQENWEKQ